MSLPSPLWSISLSSKGSSTKGSYSKELQFSLHKIGVDNSTIQPPTEEVAQSQLRLQSFGEPTRSQTLSLTTSYKVEYEVLLKKLSERWNSVRKNKRALKITENSFGKKELEDWKLKNFSLLKQTWKLVNLWYLLM